MACGCDPIPHLPNWNPPTGKPVLAVYDAVTNQLRPLAWGEAIPGLDCLDLYTQQGQIPSAKQMQDAYFSFHQRLTALEQKYCECICQGEGGGGGEIDSWQSPVVTVSLSGE